MSSFSVLVLLVQSQCPASEEDLPVEGPRLLLGRQQGGEVHLVDHVRAENGLRREAISEVWTFPPLPGDPESLCWGPPPQP